ncbi:MAG TPA: AAA family ATPase [Pseudonocardiaceae bacterium]|nr:AAA family ATPase [Pseudonocardiaceae bacterium]
MPTIRITLLGRFEVMVGTVPVAASGWTRRHAAALVKVLAMAPGRSLHREQVIDLLWPGDTIEEAVPKLHKAAHFARRAIGVTNAVVLRGENVMLCPEADTTVDVERFEALARRALAGQDAATAREALAGYGGELLPQDCYDAWASEYRERLRLRHLELLRLDERWERVAELDAGDERAHLALMRRYAADGDRHAALRQFERLARALRRELGVAPSREATALRDRLLASRDTAADGKVPLLGRSGELSIAERALSDSAEGRSRTLIVTGEAGVGKSALVAAIRARARDLGFGAGHGSAAPVEGAWPYAPVAEALAAVCRDQPTLLGGPPGHHRDELNRALATAEVSWTGASSRQRLYVAAAELLRRASATRGLLLTIDDVHDADDASLRLLHYLARSAFDQRVCLVLTHRPAPMPPALAQTRQSLIDRHHAIQIELGPLGAADVAVLVRRHVPEPTPRQLEHITALSRGIPFTVIERLGRADLLRTAETEAAVGAYRDALALVDALRPHATGAHHAAAASLRADLLNAIGGRDRHRWRRRGRRHPAYLRQVRVFHRRFRHGADGG